ncbi:MAG: TetR/AcrR family transcriptional regulator [Acidobacteria bacterium]|nr:TetR/AcrR family transcriptional regulator [Acidobacteriota bacterium]
MARPKNADGQRTRQAILDAALDLFSEKGFFGTSLRDVASAVGVRESAIYNYFPGKDALFDALLTAQLDSRLERFSPLADGPITDGRALLEQWALASLTDFVEPREEKFHRIVMSDGIRLARSGRINLYERLSTGRARHHELLRRLIDEGWLRPADVDVLGLAFYGPLFMWRQLHAINASLPVLRQPSAFVRQHVEQFLRGAAALSRGAAVPRRLVARPSSPRKVARRRGAL